MEALPSPAACSGHKKSLKAGKMGFESLSLVAYCFWGKAVKTKESEKEALSELIEQRRLMKAKVNQMVRVNREKFRIFLRGGW